MDYSAWAEMAKEKLSEYFKEAAPKSITDAQKRRDKAEAEAEGRDYNPGETTVRTSDVSRGLGRSVSEYAHLARKRNA